MLDEAIMSAFEGELEKLGFDLTKVFNLVKKTPKARRYYTDKAVKMAKRFESPHISKLKQNPAKVKPPRSHYNSLAKEQSKRLP